MNTAAQAYAWEALDSSLAALLTSIAALIASIAAWRRAGRNGKPPGPPP